jgi:hypothetical protein
MLLLLFVFFPQKEINDAAQQVWLLLEPKNCKTTKQTDTGSGVFSFCGWGHASVLTSTFGKAYVWFWQLLQNLTTQSLLFLGLPGNAQLCKLLWRC